MQRARRVARISLNSSVPSPLESVIHSRSMSRSIQRVTVIGSGTMGGGIAAHFANAGVPVYLLDISKEIVSASFDRMKKSKPPAFFTPGTADLVTIGVLDEHDDWIAEADWIIE